MVDFSGIRRESELLRPGAGKVLSYFDPADMERKLTEILTGGKAAAWKEEARRELANQTMNVQEDGGPWVEYFYGKPFSDTPVYAVETDENGFVTAIIYEESGGFSDDSIAWLHTARVPLLMQSFAGTSGSGIELANSPLLKGLTDPGAWDGSPVSAGGFVRTITLEQEGYYNASSQGGLLWREEDAESGWYRFEVRLEKNQ